MKKSKILNSAITVAALSILLAGCNEENGVNSANSVNSIDDIVGLYDFSSTYANGIIDEYYIQISENGFVTDFDYQGDTYDVGENCYDIGISEQLVHQGGGVFYSTLFEVDQNFEFLDSETLRVTDLEGSGYSMTLYVSDKSVATMESMDCANGAALFRSTKPRKNRLTYLDY